MRQEFDYDPSGTLEPTRCEYNEQQEPRKMTDQDYIVIAYLALCALAAFAGMYFINY